MGTRIETFITEKLEAWLGLKINRKKTRIVKLRSKDQRLEFLGYQIGLGVDLKTRQHYYWRLETSAKDLRRGKGENPEPPAPPKGASPTPENKGRLNQQPQSRANTHRPCQPP